MNDLHRRVDLIEVSIASGVSQCESEPKDKHTLNSNEVKNELIKLQSELDSCLPDETLFIDPPAKMIRKAANAKIERLLMPLETNQIVIESSYGVEHVHTSGVPKLVSLPDP